MEHPRLPVEMAEFITRGLRRQETWAIDEKILDAAMMTQASDWGQTPRVDSK
jgi:hypothetical protein